ncbi:hypothetical protein AB4184_25645, partial [Vibrio splendidus]
AYPNGIKSPDWRFFVYLVSLFVSCVLAIKYHDIFGSSQHRYPLSLVVTLLCALGSWLHTDVMA